MSIAEYTTSEGGPLSWGAVNKNIATVSDQQFTRRAEAYYGRKPKQGLFSKIASFFKGGKSEAAAAKSLQRPGFIAGMGFVTDSPLFDNPGGFQRQLTHEEDIRLRASAQQAMEAGRPMTVAEMYGKPQQLFTTLRGFSDMQTEILTNPWGAKAIVHRTISGMVGMAAAIVLSTMVIRRWNYVHRSALPSQHDLQPMGSWGNYYMKPYSVNDLIFGPSKESIKEDPTKDRINWTGSFIAGALILHAYALIGPLLEKSTADINKKLGLPK